MQISQIPADFADMLILNDYTVLALCNHFTVRISEISVICEISIMPNILRETRSSTYVL